MNKSHILILTIIFLMTMIPLSEAKSSDIFIEHLSSIIYVDCQGKDLIIKEPFIQNTHTNETVTLVPWPYSYDTLWKIIEILGRSEPFDDYANGCDVKEQQEAVGERSGGWLKGRDGCRILICGEHKLDIDDYAYFWDSVRIDVPKETTNIAINNQGNLVQGLSNCNIKQNQYKTELANCTIKFSKLNEKISWFSNITNMIISILSGLLVYLVLYKNSDKKRRKKALLLSVLLFIILLIATYIVSKAILYA